MTTQTKADSTKTENNRKTKMTGKEIIEGKLTEVYNSHPFEVGLFGMTQEECIAYRDGLITAYQHALEMWDTQ